MIKAASGNFDSHPSGVEKVRISNRNQSQNCVTISKTVY